MNLTQKLFLLLSSKEMLFPRLRLVQASPVRLIFFQRLSSVIGIRKTESDHLKAVLANLDAKVAKNVIVEAETLTQRNARMIKVRPYLAGVGLNQLVDWD